LFVKGIKQVVADSATTNQARENPGVVDQNIDVTISDFDRFLGHSTCARCISEIRGNKIRRAACRTNFVDRLLPALRASPYDQDMDPKLGQFISRGATDSTR
jgi:hypothetical protein